MPTTSALLKAQIEAQLAHRIPAALSPVARPEIERHRLADEQLNLLLGGGIPVGAITEVYGHAGSGRTSLAFSLAAAMTAAGNVAAWVDVADALDPEAAALCGVNLEQLLWVRCAAGQSQTQSGLKKHTGVREAATNPAERRNSSPAGITAGSFASTNSSNPPARNLVAPNHVPKPVGSGGCGSPHPRGEGRGMPEAIQALLENQPRSTAGVRRRAQKQIGTPGMPNRDLADIAAIQDKATGSEQAPEHPTVTRQVRSDPGDRPATAHRPLTHTDIAPTTKSLYGRQVSRGPLPFPHASPYREEQVATDRQPSRRAVLSPVPQHVLQPTLSSGTAGCVTPAHTGREMVENDLWGPLDQALRTVDLLLQAGGFSLLVLDLGDVPAKTAWRIPLATWFRFRAGCERSRASLLVISQHPCARASADLTVAMQPGLIRTVGSTVMVGSDYLLQMEQQRRGTNQPGSKVVSFRKPVRADHHAPAEPVWTATGTWSVRA